MQTQKCKQRDIQINRGRDRLKDNETIKKEKRERKKNEYFTVVC